MTKALITGVKGQDGSYLAEFLLDKGYQVIGMHRGLMVKNSAKSRYDNIADVLDHPNFILEYGDILEPASLWRLVNKYEPDEIYNLAAQSHVNLSFESSEITTETNALGTLSLLNIVVELVPNTRFFQASSGDMYGANPSVELDESSVFLPNTPYGCSKLFAHNIVKVYRNTYNLHASCGICFNHESPRRGDNFATQTIAKAAARIKLGKQDTVRLGNLHVKRDWGFARDYVEAMWLIAQNDSPGDYVISTGESQSLKSFVEIIFNHAGLDFDRHVIIDPELYREYDKAEVFGNSDRIQSELNWKSTTSFEQLAIEMFERALETLS